MNSRQCFWLEAVCCRVGKLRDLLQSVKNKAFIRLMLLLTPLCSLSSLMVVFSQLGGCSAEEGLLQSYPSLAGSAGKEQGRGKAAARCCSSTTTLWATFPGSSSDGSLLLSGECFIIPKYTADLF